MSASITRVNARARDAGEAAEQSSSSSDFDFNWVVGVPWAMGRMQVQRRVEGEQRERGKTHARKGAKITAQEGTSYPSSTFGWNGCQGLSKSRSR